MSTVTPLTPNAVSLGLTVPPELAEAFAYEPGQYVTVRAEVGGVTAQRSYSLCSTPRQAARDGVLHIGVSRVDGGLISTWLTREVTVGDVLQVATPRGSFGLATSDIPGIAPHHVALVAGAGITPVLPMLTVALEREERATLVFGNRDREHVMFRDDLDALAAHHVDRLRVVHVFSRAAATPELPAGRLDTGRLLALLDSDVERGAAEQWYVCGPDAFVAGAGEALRVAGIDASLVHEEAFHVAGVPARAADDTMCR